MTDNELSRIVESYKGMAHVHDVEMMTAKALLDLKAVQEERNLTNEEMRMMNARAMRAMLYGKVMTPKERAVMRKVFARLADIFGGEK